jgi:tyrosine-specific transport protein
MEMKPMHIVHTFGHLVGGILLVAGTSIGVGMLALPVATAAGGFIPSLFIYLACWLFMLCTGLLVLEACIWMPKDANLITLSSRLLGKWGKVSCWVLYLFLFSCLMIAHTAAGGDVLHSLSGNRLPLWGGIILYVLCFSPVVYLGTRWVDRLNLCLMAGLAITYLLFAFSSFRHIDFHLLSHSNWKLALWGVPVIFTAFGYQSLIPTLMTYLNRNIQKMRLAIILGTSIPFAIYIVWEMLILGIIPLGGPSGLSEALHKGQNAVTPLGFHLNNPTLLTIGQAFAFFAMTTSFVGISIAFVDFLADGLKLEKKGMKRLGICSLIFLIPMIISILDPHIFFIALNYAGGLGVALLLGAMPILMVWAGRYYEGHSLLHQQLPGGKILLFILLLFVVGVLGITLI